MNFIVYSSAILIVGVVTFLAIERPYTFASLLIFLYVYRETNFQLPGPFDARGLLTLILFARLFLFDKRNYLLTIRFLLRDLSAILLSIFIIVCFYTTYSFYGDFWQLIKSHILLFVSIILGFIIIINGQGRKVFYNAIVVAAIFSTVDLLYSTIVYGSLNVRSILNSLLLHNYKTINHSDVALICSYALVLTFLFFIRKQTPKTIAVPLMLVFSIAILFSTSRSTLVAIIPVFIIVFLVQREIQFNLNKVFTSFLGVILFFVSFYIIYNALLSSGEFKSSFLDNTYYRLYEEPMSILGGNKNKVFDKQGEAKEGTTEWRLKRTQLGLSKFSKLNLKTQLFGIGEGGYEDKNFGEDFSFGYALDAHNGYVLLLVERGIFGFSLYVFIIIYLSFKSFKLLRQGLIDVPIIYILLFLAIYCIGQNGELTNNMAFIFLGATIANTKKFDHIEGKNNLLSL